MQRIIREYTYEAGVRNLEREIGNICRKIARQKAEHKRRSSQVVATSVERYLGPPEFFNLEANARTKLAWQPPWHWTENGGEIMPVEVLLLDGKGQLQITGQIGSVMQEFGQAALSFLKSRSRQLEIDPEIFEDVDIHIHIPEGAIPKDGPSAGITICTALDLRFHRARSAPRGGHDRRDHPARAGAAGGRVREKFWPRTGLGSRPSSCPSGR